MINKDAGDYKGMRVTHAEVLTSYMKHKFVRKQYLEGNATAMVKHF